MEPELAAEAVESMQAAPGAGAGSEKEREKSALLDRMDAGEEAGDVLVVEDEPAADVAQEHAGADAEAVSEARNQAHEALLREFPDALAEGTELYEACREEMAYLRESGSPLAEDPQAQYKVARRMARLLGLSQSAAAQEPPVAAAPKNAAQPARRKLRPMPAGGAPVESPATTLERRVAGAKSTGEMLELMREIGTPFEALLKR